MRILLVHNRYQQAGGEDLVFETERDLLISRGHEVHVLEETNHRIKQMNPLVVAATTFWNAESYSRVQELIKQKNIQIMHVHNYFPLLSPSIFRAAQSCGVGVVHTLHNFRLVCVNGLLYRDNHQCEDCIAAGSMLPGVIHRCYRSDFKASLVAAAALSLHKTCRTFADAIDLFVVVNAAFREKMVRSGLPAEKIRLKPQALAVDPGPGLGAGGYAVYVGRLSPEKGVQTLLDAWQMLQSPVPLKVAGDGPLRPEVERHPRVEYLGWIAKDQVCKLISDAKFVIVPSVCHEIGPLVTVEALACGTPVIGSRIGMIKETILEAQTGFLFEPGSAQDLARVVNDAFSLSCDQLQTMRSAARRHFEMYHCADTGYDALMAIYEELLAAKGNGDGD